jgi:molecular chaperone DnaJ
VTPAEADYEVELGFYEAARGGRRTVPYTARGVCAFCMGEPCAACGGRGTRRVSLDDGDVRVLQLVECDDCGGTGRAAVDCDYCGGSGEVKVESETEITIPAGIEDGATVPIGKHDEHLVVRVRPQPRDPMILRVTAALGLVAALGFLAFLLLG